MNNNRFYIILIVTACLFGMMANSQTNLVPNSSFETRSPSASSNKPNADDQLEKCKYWKNFKSSDWYSDKPGFFNGRFDASGITNGLSGPGFLLAHTGNHYIGFGPCEGAQVELTSKVAKYSFVVVSFWWSPRTKEDTKINVYLLKKKASNNALHDCNNPDIDFEVHFEIDVNSTGQDAEHIPGQWYYYTSEQFLTIEDEYEWFAIKGDNHIGNLHHREYIYVDDVSVNALPLCYHICIPQLSSITYSTIPNAMIGNTNKTFRVLIENAMGIEFIMFDTWGGEFYHYNSFDPNGLKNPGYSDFLLEWNGNNDQGNNVPQDVYVIYLRMWNCNEQIIINNLSLTVFPPSEPAFVIPEIHNNVLADCCEDFKYYQNIEFTGTFRKDVNDFIMAGENVTSGPTGPVIVKSGANVKFVAGNQIIIEPGFSVELGANFEGIIAECGAIVKIGGISRWSEYDIVGKSNTIIEDENNTEQQPKSNNTIFESRPNPFNNSTQIIFSIQETTNVRLYITNTFGIEVLELVNNELSKGIHNITIKGSALASGIYYCILETKDRRSHIKLVKL